MTACFCHKNVPSGWTLNYDLIDHRYFYQVDDGSGRYACGLARDAVAEQLLEWNIRFADTDFLASLPEFIDNQSVAGFVIEYAVLSSIQSNGLAISAGLGKSMEVKVCAKLRDISMDITDQPVLYRPRKYNFKAIDGIIILIKPDEPNNARKKLLMFPLQITVAPATHTNSREEFFKENGSWIEDLSKFDVEVQFLWITPICREIQNHPANPKRHWPKHQERYIPFKDINEKIWEKYEDASNKLPKDKAAQKKLVPNKPATTNAATERATRSKTAKEAQAAPENAAPGKSARGKGTKGKGTKGKGTKGKGTRVQGVGGQGGRAAKEAQ